MGAATVRALWRSLRDDVFPGIGDAVGRRSRCQSIGAGGGIAMAGTSRRWRVPALRPVPTEPRGSPNLTAAPTSAEAATGGARLAVKSPLDDVDRRNGPQPRALRLVPTPTAEPRTILTHGAARARRRGELGLHEQIIRRLLAGHDADATSHKHGAKRLAGNASVSLLRGRHHHSSSQLHAWRALADSVLGGRDDKRRAPRP